MRNLSLGCYISKREANGSVFISGGFRILDQSLVLSAVKAFVLQWGRWERTSNPSFPFLSTSEFLFGIQTQCVCCLMVETFLFGWHNITPFPSGAQVTAGKEKMDLKEFAIWLNLKGISGIKKKNNALYKLGALSLPV